GDIRPRHSVPTRRSSDLDVGALTDGLFEAGLEPVAPQWRLSVEEAVEAVEVVGGDDGEGGDAALERVGGITPLHRPDHPVAGPGDRKSTRLNSSHVKTAY